MTVLHQVAEGGLDEVLDVLISLGADVNASEDTEYMSLSRPIHGASRGGHHKCVFSLIVAGAECSVMDAYGCTPLHYSTIGSHTEVIEVLLSAGVDVHMLDRKGRTALFCACLMGDAKAVTLLIDAGSDVNRKDIDGQTPLCATTKLDVVKVLLARGGSIEGVDKAGCSVLHHAARLDAEVGAICALYKAGANPLLLDSSGCTAAVRARKEGHDDVAKMLELLEAKHRSILAQSARAGHANNGEEKK